MADLAPAFAAVLSVQAEDNALVALRRRLDALPEAAALAAKQDEIGAVDAEIAASETARKALESDQRRLEGEAAMLRDRAAEEERKLYSGVVSGVKELQSLQEEVAALRRRVDQLEDGALGVLIELEPLVEAEAALAGRRAALDAEARDLSVVLAEAQGDLDREIREVTRRREEALATADPDALARYERLAPAFGGSAAVRLVGSRCEGCPLQMPAVEADRIRHLPPGVAECDECGRLVLH